MKVKDLAQNGVFSDGDWVESKDQDPTGSIRLIQLADIGDGYFINKSKRFMNEEATSRLRCTFLEKGDILIARMPDPIGRCCVFPFEDKEKYVTVVDVCILRIKENHIIDYIKYAINSPLIRRQIEGQVTGTTRLRITKKKIGELDIPLPPLPQQKKVVAILDAADEYRQKTKALITKYEELAQSLFLDMFGDPVMNTKGWEKDLLKNITTKIGSGATPRGGKEAYQKEGISLIRSMNVYDNKFKYKNLAFINDEQANKLKNVIVEENDVLFNITGASICRSTVVPKNILPARVNQHVSIIRPDGLTFNPLFISHLLISGNVKKQLLGVGSGGGAVMEAITKEQLQNYKIIVPPLKLQNQFAERIKEINAQKEQAQKSLEHSEDLFNSLLQKAFKGELTEK